MKVAEPHPERFRFHRPGWGSRICTSNKCSEDADAAGLGPHFKNYYLTVTL